MKQCILGSLQRSTTYMIEKRFVQLSNIFQKELKAYPSSMTDKNIYSFMYIYLEIGILTA